MTLVRRSRGTRCFPICAWCHNSGAALTAGGQLVPCVCGQPMVTPTTMKKDRNEAGATESGRDSAGPHDSDRPTKTPPRGGE